MACAHGKLRFTTTTSCTGLAGDALAKLPMGRPKFQGSNTVVTLGDRLFLKGYRHLRAGVNPEFEVGRFLTDVAHFANCVPVAGAMEYIAGDGTPTSLALLQGHVENQGDGWSYTLDYLDRYFESQLAVAAEAPADVHGAYLALVHTLGMRTAELQPAPHRLLSERIHMKLLITANRLQENRHEPRPYLGYHSPLPFHHISGTRRLLRGGTAQVAAFRERYREKVAGLSAQARCWRRCATTRALQETLVKPQLYAHLLFAADSENDDNKRLSQKSAEFGNLMGRELLFFDLEIIQMEEDTFEPLLEESRLAPYRHFLEALRKFRPHTLSEREESLLTQKSLTGVQAFCRLFDEVSASLRYRMEIDGEEREMTGEELLALLHHPDAALRERAFSTFLKRHQEHEILFSRRLQQRGAGSLPGAGTEGLRPPDGADQPGERDPHRRWSRA